MYRVLFPLDTAGDPLILSILQVSTCFAPVASFAQRLHLLVVSVPFLDDYSILFVWLFAC